MKYFKNGGWVDLKKLGAVDFDVTNKEATLNSTLVIIDRSPGAEPGVAYPNGDNKYGVKIAEDGGEKFLFVYDGAKDGKASDPVTLEDQSDDGMSGGPGGGCGAGVMPLAGVFALIAFAVQRKKR